MKTIYITFLCVFTLITNTFAQQQGSISEKKQLERYEKDVERKKQKYIKDFVKTLDVDDFQKEIIKQSMYSYFEEITKINGLRLKSYERDTQIELLDESHFRDLRAIVSEDVMSKIMDALTGKWDKKAEEKKKKKKRKEKEKN